MTWKMSEWWKASRTQDGVRPTEAAGVGPELAFAGAILAGVAAWGASKQTLHLDLVMPTIATLILLLAAVLAVAGWRYRGMDPDRVTYADVAGALTLIGLCVAAAIDPDQMLRIVERGRPAN
jgi:hypothetical protein